MIAGEVYVYDLPSGSIAAQMAELNAWVKGLNPKNMCAFTTIPMIPIDTKEVPIVLNMRWSIYDLNFKILNELNGVLTPSSFRHEE